MTETLSVLYIWLKSAHIIFVIFWMAGLFMIPRFFVYHQESAEGSEEAAKWVDRESNLIKIILNPSILIKQGLSSKLLQYLLQQERLSVESNEDGALMFSHQNVLI